MLSFRPGFGAARVRAWTALAVQLGCLPLSAAVLSGNFVPLAPGTNVNLTTVGTLDWVHWGLDTATSVNRKSSVVPRIGPLAVVGANPVQRLATNQAGLGWSDGTPTLAVTNSSAGLFVQGLTNGFAISVEAGTERRRLRIFAGVEAATGLLEATLSDASAPDYYDESLASFGALSNGVFVLDFAAASSGQTLTVTFTAESPSDETAGRVLLQAIALASNLPPAAQLVLPTNNAVFYNSASITLAANASDSDGSIQRVEFYQGTHKLGEALGLPYTFQWDNVAPGNYSLTARAFDDDGAFTASAPVAVTVLANFAPTVALTNLVNYMSFALPTNITLAATASDVDGTIAKVEFFAGSTKIGEATNSPYVFNWTNASSGEYLITARATDNKGASSVSSAVDIFVTRPGGYLAVSAAPATEPVFLETEGPADWVHWGLHTGDSYDHKRGVVSQITNYTLIGNGPAYNFSDSTATYNWTDGTPTAAATNTPTGVYLIGSQNGFRLQAAASLTTNTLKIYVGTYAARGRLLANLSDLSAPVISDLSSDNSGNGPSTVYTIRYAASASGNVLNLSFWADSTYASDGNVTLQAAALDTGNRPPSVTVTNPTNGATLRWPTNVTVSAEAADVDGSVTNVEFFRDGFSLGQRANAPYALVWSNATPGSHSLTARATDNLGVTFTSPVADVFVSTGGGSLAASFASPPAQVDLTAEGLLDWTHWGLTSGNSFDHRSGATTRISNAIRIGNGSIKQYADNYTGYSWTNGTPTAVASASHTGIFIYGLSNGFQITAPADPARRRLKVYVGLFAARGRFVAGLSDSSARSFTDISLLNAYGSGYRVYTIDYASATPGQQLVVRQTSEEVFDTVYGNVTLQSASLADLPTLRLLDAAWDGTAFRFRLPTLSNRSYTAQFTDALPATNWQPFQNFPGAGVDVWVTNFTARAPQRLYRVVEY